MSRAREETDSSLFTRHPSLNTESPGDSCFLVKQTDLFAANVAHHSRIANTVGVSKSVFFPEEPWGLTLAGMLMGTFQP